FLGRMADAAHAGDKDHSSRANSRYFLSIVAGPAGHELRSQPEPSGGFIDQLLQGWVGQRRLCKAGLTETEPGSVERADPRGFLLQPAEHVVYRLLVQVAQLQSEDGFSGNHVISAGLGLDPSHGSYLAPWLAGHNLIHSGDETSRGQQGVMALVHRSGSGMIGETVDGHIGMQDTDDSLDYSY